MTHQDEPKAVAFKPIKSFWNVPEILLAATVTFGVMIVAGAVMVPLSPVSLLTAVLGGAIALGSAVTLLQAYTTFPRLVEFTPDQIRVYLPFRFVYLSVSQIRDIELCPGDAFWKPGYDSKTIYIVDSTGRKILLRPGAFKDPKAFKSHVYDLCRPVIAQQKVRLPKPVWSEHALWPQVVKFSLWAALVAFMAYQSITLKDNQLFEMTFVVGILGSGIHFYKSHRVTFRSKRMQVRTFFTTRSVAYDDVIELMVSKKKSGTEKLTAYFNTSRCVVFSSRKPGYLHVRNFLIAKCEMAKVTGNVDPTHLQLSPFETTEHKTKLNPYATQHPSLGDTP